MPSSRPSAACSAAGSRTGPSRSPTATPARGPARPDEGTDGPRGPEPRPLRRPDPAARREEPAAGPSSTARARTCSSTGPRARWRACRRSTPRRRCSRRPPRPENLVEHAIALYLDTRGPSTASGRLDPRCWAARPRPDRFVLGLDGADALAGGPGTEALIGRGGDDRLRGLRGDDLLSAGPGTTPTAARATTRLAGPATTAIPPAGAATRSGRRGDRHGDAPRRHRRLRRRGTGDAARRVRRCGTRASPASSSCGSTTPPSTCGPARSPERGREETPWPGSRS
jgi:hypothetical protein